MPAPLKSKVGQRILFALAGVGLLIALGPREHFPQHTFHLPLVTDNFEAELSTSEKLAPHLRPDLAKHVLWVQPGKKTWGSILYLHGYSASPKEITPVVEDVAQKLGMNVFFQRLRGHGQDGEAMADATVEQWLQDTEEGLAVARRLGERVFVVGMSTGASLGVWLANQPQSSISGMVLLSPNFGPHDHRAEILTWPWGSLLANLISGGQHKWTPISELQRQRWTIEYPTRALLPLMALVSQARSIDLTRIQVPALFVITPHDDVLDTKPMIAAYAAWGAADKKLEVLNDAKYHVLAGESVSPDMNGRVEGLIEAFLGKFSH